KRDPHPSTSLSPRIGRTGERGKGFGAALRAPVVPDPTMIAQETQGIGIDQAEREEGAQITPEGAQSSRAKITHQHLDGEIGTQPAEAGRVFRALGDVLQETESVLGPII